MAITRRRVIKLGVSFGSGCIKFGNDELAFCDALREFPHDGSYAAFREAFDAIDAEALAAAQARKAEEEQEAAEQDATEKKTARKPTAGKEGAPEEEHEAAGQAEAAEQAEAPDPTLPYFDLDLTEEEDEEEEQPLDPSIVNALQAAQVFRKECSRLALSDLYLQMTTLINTLSEGTLPPIADLKKLDEDYQALVDYLSTH